MSPQSTLEEILSSLKQSRNELEAEIERLLEGKREQFSYTIRKGRAVFDRNIRKRHRRQRISSWRYILAAPISVWLTAPFIYGMSIPIALLDAAISLYQHVCFRVYKIPLVVRHEFINIDRHRLPYLNWVQKINCIYCSYGSGVLAYASEIIARTEQFWCPIKHAVRTKGLHDREQKFFDYGDADAWQNELKVIRCDWDDALPENLDDNSSKSPEDNNH